MFSSCFFCMLVKWEVVSPNTSSRYREFYHEIGNIEKFPFTYWLNGGRWFLQIVDIHVGNFNMKITGRWFPQIVDRDTGNLYPIYIKQKLWCLFLNLFAGDLGRPSCLVYIRNTHTCTIDDFQGFTNSVSPYRVMY